MYVKRTGARKARARRKTARLKWHGLVPRRKRERERLELMTGATLALFIMLSLGVFWVSSVQQKLLRSPNVAAVVSAVLVQLANTDRAQNGLQDLTVSPKLVEAAQAKANDMASKGYFAHVSPQGIDPWFWFKQVGYSFDYAGENLAVDFSDSGDVNTAWMNSPEHRANILDPHYTQVGIATAQGMYKGRLTTFVVQEFGTPASAAKQSAVAVSTTPEDPKTIATASTKPAPAVLGSAAAEQKPPVSTAEPAPKPEAVATTSPVLAAQLAETSQTRGVPLWGYIVGFPKTAAHVAYYVIAFLVILALLFDTGLQLKEHHRKKARHAAYAIAVVCVCFVLADYVFFTQPVLAAIASSLGP